MGCPVSLWGAPHVYGVPYIFLGCPISLWVPYGVSMGCLRGPYGVAMGCLWGLYGALRGPCGALWGAQRCGRPLRVVLVLGAGRGPLVNATLRAARQAARRVRVYAVEKNPNAVVT